MADREAKRRIQKRRLAENMIDRDAEVEIRTRSSGKGWLLIFLFTVLLIVLFLIYRYESYTGREAETVWEKAITESGATVTFRGYEAFGNGVIMYTKDGAEYTDREGRSVWQKSYQMNSPIISVNGDYAVIADQGGTAACVFSGEQNTGMIATVMPISKVAVSGTGVVYAVENDTNADFLMAYRKDGTQIDLTVKSVIDGDGYPFDLAVSPNGSQLLTSYIGIADGGIRESVVFRNFGEVGQNADARRVVGGFIDEFDGHIVTKVSFADEEHSHAFYESGVAFFSTRVLNSPEIIQKVEPEGEILSVADSGRCVALITEAEQGENRRKLLIFDQEGKQTGEAEVTIPVSGLEVTGSEVIVYSTDHICAYSDRGRILADLSWDGRISSVCGTNKRREYLVAENGRLLLVRAK